MFHNYWTYSNYISTIARMCPELSTVRRPSVVRMSDKNGKGHMYMTVNGELRVRDREKREVIEPQTTTMTTTIGIEQTFNTVSF